MRRALVRRRLDLSGVTMGVTAGVTRNVAPTEGGVPQKQRRGCHIPPVHVSPSLFGLFVLDRLTRAAPAGREKTGATPPFVPLARHGVEGGATPGITPGATPPPASGGGRSRLNVSLQEGSDARPGGRVKADERRDD